MAYKQTRDDLLQHLREQIDVMRANAAQFDAGHEHFAKPISTVLRNLLHGGRALLLQLDLLHTVRFVDSGGPIDPTTIVETPRLTTMGFRDGRMVFLPRLAIGAGGGAGGRLSFTDWWETPVLRDENREMFTRQQLTLALAHKDGGSHIDPGMSAAYAALSRSGGLGWKKIAPGGEEKALTDNVALPCVRQIAWEVDYSLTEQVPELLPPLRH